MTWFIWHAVTLFAAAGLIIHKDVYLITKGAPLFYLTSIISLTLSIMMLSRGDFLVDEPEVYIGFFIALYTFINTTVIIAIDNNNKNKRD